jgi:protoporphyrinogen oxidase
MEHGWDFTTNGQDYLDYLGKTEYLGIVCPLVVLDRPLSGFWTLNITDERIPFTGVIETTSYIDPKYVGGHFLVYLQVHGPGQPVANQIGRGD